MVKRWANARQVLIRADTWGRAMHEDYLPQTQLFGSFAPMPFSNQQRHGKPRKPPSLSLGTLWWMDPG